MRNVLSIFILIILLPVWTTGQKITILSKDEKIALPFVHVQMKPLNGNEKKQVLLTDSAGKVSIPSVLTKQIVVITISCIGYERLNDTTLFENDKIYFLKSQAQLLNQVVVTGQYAPNSPEKATHKIKIIDRKKIDGMAAQNLRDILSNEINIRLSQDNILGSSMSMQGVSGQNVKILIDGVPVVGRQNGNVDLSQINLNNIERIEIIEGPMSVSYGTNALAGTINLITKKSQKKVVEAGLTSYYETIGNYNASIRAGYSKGKHSIFLSGGRNFFDGWNPGEKIALDNKPTLADSSRFYQWKPKEQYMCDAQYIFRFRKLNFNYKGSYFEEVITNKGYPRAPYGETAFDDYYNTKRFDNALFVNGEIAKHKNINFLASYNDFGRIKNTSYKDLTTLNEVLTENTSDQDTSRFTLFNSRATYSTSKDSVKINYELGYDVNMEKAYGQRITDKQQEINDYAVFVTAEYNPIEQFTIRPGLRYAYNTKYKSPLTPSVNLKYKTGNVTMRASYAKGFRAPDLKELYFYFVDINHNIVGNDQLKAEHADNYNLSAVYSIIKNSKIYKLEGSLFYNNIRNLIVLAQTTGAEYSYINIGKYKTTGIQLNTELGINHLKVSLGGSYIGRYNELSTSANVDMFSYTPEVKSAIMYEFKKINLTIAAFYKYSGRLPGYILDENDEVKQTFINSYHTGDLSVSKKTLKDHLVITLGGKNLFDVKNVTAVASGGAHSSGANNIPVSTGRTYFLKMDFIFNSKK